MLTLAAVTGAVVALGVRELVEWRERFKHKQDVCIHDFYETTWFGRVTKHCRKCRWQEPEEDDRR